MSSNKKVLRSCRAVLHPESRGDEVPRIAADKYAKGCVCCHPGKRAKRRNSVEHFAVFYDDKLPRLLVHRRRRTHRRREELLYALIVNLFFFRIFARFYAFEWLLARPCSLSSGSYFSWL